MKNFLKSFGGLILTLLGFGGMATGCFPFRCEYGCPHADFRAEITVADKEGHPLQAIRTILRYTDGYNDENSEFYQADTLYTSNLGVVQLSKSVFSSPLAVDIIYDDLSGVFESDSTMGVVPVQIKEGDKKWYSGEFLITDTKLLKKK